ncbi:MAG: hypothetical protein AAF724_16645 [Pseudomonadota bacterium]
MSVLTGMVGHGFYNENSAPQMASIEHVLPWLDAACSSVDLSDPSAAIRLADFGCSEGRNSVAVMQRMAVRLRQRSALPIETIHSDLPTNDYSQLFALLRPQGRSAFNEPDIFSAVVGGSMYDRLLPARSLHMAFTFNAIAFLSRRPVERLPGYIFPNGPSALRGIGTISETERKAFADQARADLDAFLRVRAAELKPGGKLLIEVFGAGETLRTCDGIYDVLNDAILALLEAGTISRDDYDRYYQPVYMRTLDELIAPVVGPGAPMAELFQLDRSDTYEIAVPFVETFKQTGDIKTYAREFTNFYRAFTEAVLRDSFSHYQDLDHLIDDIYARAEQLVSRHPERYEFHYIAIAALLTRKA